MNYEKIFCKACGQPLNTNKLLQVFNAVKSYELEDGWYCEKCARIKIAKKRGQIK